MNNPPAHEYTSKGEAVFKQFMTAGYNAIYIQEVRRLLKQQTQQVILTEVIGEQQYYLYLNHGWELQQVESPSYGQLFKHRHMKIDREVLQQQIEEFEAAAS